MAANLPACHVEDAKQTKLSMSPSQMCECFQSRLAKDLGSDTDLSDLRVTLRAPSAHEVEASVTKASGDEAAILPPMTVKVLDRPISSGDVQSLAASVARALLNQKR